MTSVTSLGNDSDDHCACQKLNSSGCDSIPDVNNRYYMTAADFSGSELKVYNLNSCELNNHHIGMVKADQNVYKTNIRMKVFKQ